MKKLLFLTIAALLLLSVATGCKSEQPKDGKSAYELAVENGFTGTVDEWLTSLIGEKGDPGQTGVGIADITVDYKGHVVITLTNGEKYETTIDKACAHTNMQSIVTSPVCGEGGFTSYSCPDCGLSYVDDYTAPTGHHLYNDECLFCGYKVPYSEIEPDTSWYDTSVSSYTLSTREQLAGLSYLVNNGTNFSGKTVTLANSIDLDDAEWVPIGTNGAPFQGTFDGRNFTVSGLKITTPTSYVGFFGYVSGSIKNFSITGANIGVSGTLTIDNYAAIACAYSTGKIENVHTAGYLNATVTNYVGGVVGYVGSSVLNCSNSAEINAPETNNVGGIAGRLSCTGNYDLLNLTNSGKIVGADYVGGIIGYLVNHASWSYNDDTYRNQFDSLVNSGSISGETYIGGLIGYTYAAITGSSSDGSVILTVSNVKNTADVTAEKTYAGGLFGYLYTDTGSSQILKSESSGTITASAYVGGLAGKLENLKMIDCSNAGSQVNATYYETDGTTYYAYVGGYAGYGYYVENCHNTVNITYGERGMYVGGIAGYTVGSLNDCSNTADINAENASYVGGLAGRFSNHGSFDFATLSNSGNITGTDYVAGLIGAITDVATWSYNDSTYRLNMTGFNNTGKIVGYNYVGGFSGHLDAYISGSSSDGSVIVTLTDSSNIADVSGDSYVGGIFGYGNTDTGSSQITKTNSSGTITSKTHIGGLAGMLSNIKLIDCDNSGTQIVATSYVADGTTYYAYVGGYVGHGYYIENCHNKADITYNERGSYVGGIAGEINESIVNCSNSGNITAGKANYVGGLAGMLSKTGNLSLTDLNNSGNVSGADYVGGIIGYFNDHATWNYNDSYYTVNVRNVINTANVNGGKYVGGLIGRINAQITGSSSDGSVYVTVLESDNTGNIVGSESVGSFFGEFYSDRASTVSGYSLTATVNGATVTVDTLVGVKSNLTITEA